MRVLTTLKHSLCSCRSKDVSTRVVRCSCRCNRHEILINLIHVGRLDLLGKLPPYSFVVPEEVVKEVTASDQAQALQTATSSALQVSPATLDGAEREAARIIGKAGLRTDWLNCPVKSTLEVAQDPCREPLQPMDIVLRLIPEPQINKYEDSVFGFVVVPILASVYVNYAVERAKRDNAEFEIPMVLGNVIAHEIGHLLLGLNSHSASGIMQGRWQSHQARQAVTGNLLFTEKQGQLMRAEMQKRANVQTAATR
jgi:hypothetical protein